MYSSFILELDYLIGNRKFDEIMDYWYRVGAIRLNETRDGYVLTTKIPKKRRFRPKSSKKTTNIIRKSIGNRCSKLWQN